MAMLARDVPAHGVVPRECAAAVRTRHADALVPLADVRAQVGLVPVQPLAVRALQLLACNPTTSRSAHTIHISVSRNSSAVEE